MLRTKDGKREFKLYFEKSKLSFGIMAPIGSSEIVPIAENTDGEHMLVSNYELVNFSNIKGSIIEEKNFQVEDKSNKTIILEKVVNLDRLPRARFTLKDDEYSS